jgi:mannose-1-phosphate guanylyltransferase
MLGFRPVARFVSLSVKCQSRLAQSCLSIIHTGIQMMPIERRTARRGAPPQQAGDTWAIVLAAGEGTRLRSLTMDAGGDSVPKQFCALRSGPSLLHETLRRAEAVVDPSRVCTIVAQQHGRWWVPALAGSFRGNVIVQPQNRGTANGILLALWCVLERDPAANVVVLPSDHYVGDEPTLCAGIRRSLHALRARDAEIVLLGVAPEEIDSDLGYIVPGQRSVGVPVSVRKFVEKPAAREARALIEEGALWNVFILAARARSLLDLVRGRNAAIVEQMRAAWQLDARSPLTNSALTELYRGLPTLDFSRDVAAGRESSLSVLHVPSCGWSDLGTPERVAKVLMRPVAERASFLRSSTALSLEEGFLRRQAMSERAQRTAAAP